MFPAVFNRRQDRRQSYSPAEVLRKANADYWHDMWEARAEGRIMVGCCLGDQRPHTFLSNHLGILTVHIHYAFTNEVVNLYKYDIGPKPRYKAGLIPFRFALEIHKQNPAPTSFILQCSFRKGFPYCIFFRYFHYSLFDRCCTYQQYQRVYETYWNRQAIYVSDVILKVGKRRGTIKSTGVGSEGHAWEELGTIHW